MKKNVTQVLPTKHFEVHEVDVVFRAWLQAHGGRVVNSAPVSMESPGRQTWYYEAIPGAVVLLEIDIRPDVLAVTAKLTTGRAGAAYTWNGDKAKLAAFNDLCAAIRTHNMKVRVREVDRMMDFGSSKGDALKHMGMSWKTYHKYSNMRAI